MHVTGVDVNSAMAPYARDAAGAAGLPPERLRLLTGDVQALPFGDGSFDVVVCTLVGAATWLSAFDWSGESACLHCKGSHVSPGLVVS